MFKMFRFLFVIIVILALVIVFVLPDRYRKGAIAKVKELSSVTSEYVGDKLSTTVDDVYKPNEELRKEVALYDTLYQLYEENRKLKIKMNKFELGANIRENLEQNKGDDHPIRNLRK